MVIAEANELKSIVLADGTDLYYQLYRGNNGETPIVFVHGWAGSSNDWTNIVTHYTKQGYTCLIYDAVGFGKSQFPSKKVAQIADFSIDRYNADLLILLDVENLAKVKLIGHSWGGVVAMAFAEKHPERVESLFTVGSAYYNPNGWLDVLFKWISWVMAWIIIFSKPFLRLSQRLRRVAVRRYTLKSLPLDEGETIMANVLASDNRAIYKTLLAGYQVNFKKICPAISVPTMYVGATADVAAPLEFVTPFVELTPGAKYGIIPDCGHFPMLEKPQALIQLLDSFWYCQKA